MDLNEVVCFCMDVTGQAIVDAIKNGAATVEEIQEATGAGTVCGGCLDQIEMILNEYKDK